MFKCKIDLAAFDKNDNKVADIDLNKAKALANAGCKKLAAQKGEKTPFYVVKDYFKEDGKSIGNFLAFGISNKMEKHFLKHEMKGKDTAMAKSAKEASMGMVWCEDIDGRKVLHFEPHPKSKIPLGQWPKVLKGIKHFINGMKAVLVVAGQASVELEASEDNADNNADTTPNESTSVTEQIKTLIRDIGAAIKQNITAEVMPNIKQKNVTNADLDKLIAVVLNIHKLNDLYDTAEDNIKKSVKGNVDKINAYEPQLSKIVDTINYLLGQSSTTDTPDNADTNQEALDEAQLLKEAQAQLDAYKKDIGTIKNQISSMKDEDIEGGKDMLASLGL